MVDCPGYILNLDWSCFVLILKANTLSSNLINLLKIIADLFEQEKEFPNMQKSWVWSELHDVHNVIVHVL